MNIYEKIIAIMQDVQYLAKDDNVKFGNTNYKALSEEKVTTIMRQEMLKYKLVVFPVEQFSHRENNITHVDVKYRMVNVENPKEFIEITSCGDGADTQDKGSGKAMTYAFKYMWLRTFALPTGEDPDKISAEELNDKFEKERQKAEAVKAPDIQPEGPKCEYCGREIMPFNNSKEKFTAVQMAARAKQTYGHELCLACARMEQQRLQAGGGK